ncbi:hypothetical protein ACTJKN_18895 [Pedobacter sp. 22163]
MSSSALLEGYTPAIRSSRDKVGTTTIRFSNKVLVLVATSRQNA